MKKCLFCGLDNNLDAQFCSRCGQSLASGPPNVSYAGQGGRPGNVLSQQQIETMAHDMVSQRWEKLIYRIFGGVGWLMVAFGTLMIAIGYLGLMNESYSQSYYSSPLSDFNLIGYGIIAYAIAAICVAVTRFVRNP